MCRSLRLRTFRLSSSGLWQDTSTQQVVEVSSASTSTSNGETRKKVRPASPDLSNALYQRIGSWQGDRTGAGHQERSVTTQLLYGLPTQTSTVITALLELFCSAAAYSSKNGQTVHKIASVFGSVFFFLRMLA